MKSGWLSPTSWIIGGRDRKRANVRRQDVRPDEERLPRLLRCGIVSAMDPDANKRLVEQFYEEVWARGNVEFAAQVFVDDYVRHDLRPAQAAPGPLGQAQIAQAFREAFPDLQWRIDLLLADGDLVAARWTASGTHTGPWAGAEATRRRVEFSGVNIFRFGHAGKVVEIWNHRDDLGLREQLGVAVYAGPPPASES